MKNADIELIQRVLDGDDTAFSELVNKYRKSVHALAWRKVQDFHIAEDITQETFLKAYKGIPTLKEPQSFAGWLYVIATNHCNTYIGKKRLQTQSLEDTDNEELEKATYSSYVSAENERVSVETKREVVKKLLAKLQESDRTVITLYYLGGMTYEEISKFLGVSVSAIKNRLYRARQFLKKEEPMIREALENYQITPNLTENIMQEISRLKPTPSTIKPLVPWAIAASSAILIVLMLGIGSQNLVRFQQPYSLDAQAEMTVQLVDTPIVLNIDTNPDVRNQLGNTNVLGISENEGQKPDEVLLAAAETEEEDKVSAPKQKWIQGNTPAIGFWVRTLFPTAEGEIYSVDGGGTIYKLPINGTEWQQVNDISSLLNESLSVPMVKLNDTLYVVTSNELFASTDGGKTLLPVSKCPAGRVVGLVTMDDTFYLGLENNVYRSIDAGVNWTEMSNGLTGRINTLEGIQDTLFAATDKGLYRLNVNDWERLQLPVPEQEPEGIGSFAGTENTLYVMAKLNLVSRNIRSWWILRSTDKGNTWTDISPNNAWPFTGSAPSVILTAAGKTVLAIGGNDGAVVRSIDSGNTWILKETTGIPVGSLGVTHAVALDEEKFYTFGNAGILHSIDAGISWERAKLYKESLINNLIFIRTNKEQNPLGYLYAMSTSDVFRSSDNGKVWQIINPKIQITKYRSDWWENDNPPIFTRIGENDDILYAKYISKSFESDKTGLYRLSTDGNTLAPIQGIPIFDSHELDRLLNKGRTGVLDVSKKSFVEQMKENYLGADQFFRTLARGDTLRQDELLKQRLYQNQYRLIERGLSGNFAVSGDTYYMEYNFKLFRWKPGDTAWYDTGVEETTELLYTEAEKEFKRNGLSEEKIYEIFTTWYKGFKIAVSENTVYVGKRDGELVVSFDAGNNWVDVTPIMPYPVRAFKEIQFADSTVFVATDDGVIASTSGNNWHPVTDADGTNLIMETLAVDGNTIYGATKNTGIYRLENGTWEQVVSEETLHKVISLAVDGDTVYVCTESREDNSMLYFNLKE